jgi:hypothetical protein
MGPDGLLKKIHERLTAELANPPGGETAMMVEICTWIEAAQGK